MRKYVAASMAAAALAVLSIASVASASHTVSVDNTATVSPNGRQVHVSGELACDPGDRRSTVIVTVTNSVASASGKSGVACRDGVTPWEATVRVRGPGPLFEAGAAQVFVEARGHDSVFAGWLPLIIEAAP
jgi:hypothetical protein